MTLKRKMIQCVSVLNRDAVRRESINGVEHVIVSSFTMPDDIVMNEVLYPAEEIARSFKTLERTLAPVEHPQDVAGDFISATDPHAIHNFYAGAYNVNVSQVKGRVHIEKHINVQEAIKTDRGKRLMDRIEELETNDKARPIHTSAGIFLALEETDSVQTNAEGDQYTWIARDMTFDHDAILLDSVAAAPPNKGVGMAVNSEGDKVEVERFMLTPDKFNKIKVNADHGMSHHELIKQLNKLIEEITASDFVYVVDVFEDIFIFETKDVLFQASYSVTDEVATISSTPIRVEREVTYIPVINSKGDSMKDLILNVLKDAKIDTKGMDDKALFKAYNALPDNGMKDLILNALKEAKIDIEGLDDKACFAAYTKLLNQPIDGDIAVVVAQALKPLVDKIVVLETRINSNANEELEKLAKIIGNSDKFPGLTEEMAKKLSFEELQVMAANCGQGYCVPFLVDNSDNKNDPFVVLDEMQA